jgi:hypothetical protein
MRSPTDLVNLARADAARERKELKMATMIDTGAALERAVLERVPKVGYHIHLCPFPGALYACMQYLGDPCDYDYLMGVTGAAFRRFWQRDDGGNVDLMYLAPEPDRRAFRALGYAYATVPRTDKGAMVAAIRASVARGRPVIAFGIIGPPEAGIVAGYDHGGAVLYGYSYFQEEALPGYYERADWFETMAPGGAYGLIVIGDKRPSRPSEREILAETLAWAVDLARRARRPERPKHVSGLAAYDAWASALEVDADYPRDDQEMLGQRVMVHGDQTVMLSERRSAATYLRSMTIVAPEAVGALEAAASCYEAVAACEQRVWRWGASMGPEVGRDLADPAIRRAIAAAVRAAAAEEARAVELLEQAQEAMRRASKET